MKMLGISYLTLFYPDWLTPWAINFACCNFFLLDAPKVLMPATTHGYYLQRGAVNCQVESLIPFTLRFSRDGRRLGVDQLFRWAGLWRRNRDCWLQKSKSPKRQISWGHACFNQNIAIVNICLIQMMYFHQKVILSMSYYQPVKSIFLYVRLISKLLSPTCWMVDGWGWSLNLKIRQLNIFYAFEQIILATRDQL